MNLNIPQTTSKNYLKFLNRSKHTAYTLEGNIGKGLCELRVGKYFLEMTESTIQKRTNRTSLKI